MVLLYDHTDYREPATLGTGALEDLELAVITGWGPQRVTEFLGKCPLVREEEVTVLGYREPGEIENSNISALTVPK